jgi:hypothetical protein
MTEEQVKKDIKTSLHNFSAGNLTENALNLFKVLGYITERQAPLDKTTFVGFSETYLYDKKFDIERARVDEWKYIDLLFQLSKEEVLKQTSLFDTKQVDRTIIETYLFITIELSGFEYSRTVLAQITREINRVFPMPVLILFKYYQNLTLSVINRRLHKRDESKDVLEKVTQIKDIKIETPHRAHLEILFDLSFDELNRKYHFSNFIELHNAWQRTLDTKELNKRFYSELFNWYLWAVRSVKFPNDVDDDIDNDVYNSESVIRLLTRLIFVWFIKEKNLVPDILFDERALKSILKDLKPNSTDTSTYYRAILQNLFFATLNTQMDNDVTKTDEKRRFVNILPRTNNPDYTDQTKYRYKGYFINPDKALKLFSSIPFLNGGLFECLDSKEQDPNTGKWKEFRYDGFSSKEGRQAFVPDKLFFAPEFVYDLNEEYGTKGKSYKVEGLLNILNSYKFTITENTPLDEEIALDPELLGKVFENLLASYNPETQTTARKQTGSFYTPREIVNYMVDETLIAYLKQKLSETPENEDKLRCLFAPVEEIPSFTSEEIQLLLNSLSTAKILDPACGSGAFPMGILHRMVDLLKKLDPNNTRWFALQKQRAINETSDVFNSGDTQEREIRLSEINKAFDLSMNYPDYARKLFLIENCIYGVDIQQIAIQISKLRFFISLIVDQKVDDLKPNRNILSMPNLETRFVAANTLIGLDKPQQMSLIADEVNQLEKELLSIRHKIFFTRKYHEKKELKKKDKTKREQLQSALERSGYTKNTAAQMAGWNPFDPMKSALFFDIETMFGFTDGFDVIIGNPPYIKEYTFKKAFDGLRSSPYYQGKMDLWYIFACKGLDFTKSKSGLLTFIATNNWTTNTGASKMRNKIIDEAYIEKLLDFGSYKIFESSDIQTMVMIFRNYNLNHEYTFELRRLFGDKLCFDDVLDLLEKKQTKKTEYLLPTITKKALIGKTLTFNTNLNDIVLEQIEKKRNFQLDEYKEVAQGIVIPQDSLNRANQKKLGNNFRIGQGIFVINENEKAELKLNDKELQLVKPYYTTKQLHKWFGNEKNDEWIIYTDSKYKYPYNIKSYPSIKRHLDLFQDIITSDNKPYGLHRAREEYFFKDDKIIVLRKCPNAPVFTYTNFDCYVSATFYIIKSGRINLKYLTAILNSKLIAFWLRNKGKMQGNNYQLDKEPILQIPICKIENMEIFERIVNYIILLKRHNLISSYFEQLVDGMIYEVYFSKQIKAAGSEVLKHFSNLPKLIDGNDTATLKANLQIIDKMQKELNDPKHPVSAAMFKMDTIEEIRIIEGKQ